MSTARGFGRTDVARCWAGFASFGAGLIHIAVVREHFAESWPQGVFFTAVGLAQVGWALLAMHRPDVPIPRLTGVATLGLIALWGVSRTVGLSLDPLRSVPEPVGRADLLAVLLEVALILCILAAVPRPTSLPRTPEATPSTTSSAASSARFVALLAAGALAVSVIATPAMAATKAGQYAHGHGH